MEQVYFGVVHNGEIKLFGDPHISDGSRVSVSFFNPDESPPPVELLAFPPEMLDWARNLLEDPGDER